jgi:ATP-dependent exoDNAse (exonuclease V) beta subunit
VTRPFWNVTGNATSSHGSSRCGPHVHRCGATPARIIKPEQNYRSTQPILDACNGVINLAQKRFTKELFSERKSTEKPRIICVRDETAQARYVADRIVRNCKDGMSLRSQAVLFRSSRHSAQLEIELAKRGIPFVKWGGIKFLESAHIKDAIGTLPSRRSFVGISEAMKSKDTAGVMEKSPSPDAWGAGRKNIKKGEK